MCNRLGGTVSQFMVIVLLNFNMVHLSLNGGSMGEGICGSWITMRLHMVGKGQEEYCI